MHDVPHPWVCPGAVRVSRFAGLAFPAEIPIERTLTPSAWRRQRGDLRYLGHAGHARGHGATHCLAGCTGGRLAGDTGRLGLSGSHAARWGWSRRAWTLLRDAARDHVVCAASGGGGGGSQSKNEVHRLQMGTIRAPAILGLKAWANDARSCSAVTSPFCNAAAQQTV